MLTRTVLLLASSAEKFWFFDNLQNNPDCEKTVTVTKNIDQIKCDEPELKEITTVVFNETIKYLFIEFFGSDDYENYMSTINIDFVLHPNMDKTTLRSFNNIPKNMPYLILWFDGVDYCVSAHNGSSKAQLFKTKYDAVMNLHSQYSQKDTDFDEELQKLIKIVPHHISDYDMKTRLCMEHNVRLIGLSKKINKILGRIEETADTFEYDVTYGNMQLKTTKKLFISYFTVTQPNMRIENLNEKGFTLKW